MQTLPKSRFRQFSLRSGVALFLLLCIAFGFAARWYHDVRARGEAQRRLFQRDQNNAKRDGIDVYVRYATEKKVNWAIPYVRQWVHPEAYHQIEGIGLAGESLSELEIARDVANTFGADAISITCRSITAQFAANVFRAPQLKKLYLNCDAPTEAGDDDYLRELTAATQLEQLALRTPLKSPNALASLTRLPRLNDLNLFECTPEVLEATAAAPYLKTLAIGAIITGEENESDKATPAQAGYEQRVASALTKLGAHKTLESLDITGPLAVNPFQLDAFCKNSRLKRLRLYRCDLNQAVLAQVATMPYLEVLEIFDERLADEDIAPLLQAGRLKSLAIGPQITDDMRELLRKALPLCKIQKLADSLRAE